MHCSTGVYSAVGCYSGTVSLQCAAGKTINATSAVYGQSIYPHAFTCPGGCCPPNPQYDCTELVYDNSPQDWLAIKYLCDGQQSCEFQYTGSDISSCQTGYTADYVKVEFNCLPSKFLYV